jgi:hypothetical protein
LRDAVYADGRVCISILHKPGGTAEIPDDTPASECWRPILNIEAIIVSVLSMLSDPNFSSPANLDASVRRALSKTRARCLPAFALFSNFPSSPAAVFLAYRSRCATTLMATTRA